MKVTPHRNQHHFDPIVMGDSNERKLVTQLKEDQAARLDRHLIEELAGAYGIATYFWNYVGKKNDIETSILLKILEALDVTITSNEDIIAALTAVDEKPWRRVLPPSIIMREDADYIVHVHVPHMSSVELELELEDGSWQNIDQVDNFTQPRHIDGQLTGQASFRLPPGLPLGWHKLHARGSAIDDSECRVAVTPSRLTMPSLRNDRAWGIMAQLYSVRSARSWGHGDAQDLSDLATLCASRGADFLLINPVHADNPVPPLNPSPYLPTSRRFVNPIYIRPMLIPEAYQLSDRQRASIDILEQQAKVLGNGLIDRDRSWLKKMQALEIIYQQPRSYSREQDFQAFCHNSDGDVQKFALWSALIEKYGSPLPDKVATIEGPGVEEEKELLADRIVFFQWLQWIASEQLREAHDVAIRAGARIGIMHDLAVGVDPYGADPWLAPHMYAQGITVGAPADMYNQMGQNWSQPPWRPDALEESAYRPLRVIVQRLASMGGALRIDHIMGLFRLWWIPHGVSPALGTYVRYDHEAMVGVLLLEAYRQGVVVIGEDLGTVEPGVREYLSSRGILGTGVFWFEYEDGTFMPPQHYRDLQLATVTTHDLPPTAGYLREVHVAVREALGLLEDSVDQAREDAREERLRMLALLESQGFISEQVAQQLRETKVLEIHDESEQNPAPMKKEKKSSPVPTPHSTAKVKRPVMPRPPLQWRPPIPQEPVKLEQKDEQSAQVNTHKTKTPREAMHAAHGQPANEVTSSSYQSSPTGKSEQMALQKTQSSICSSAQNGKVINERQLSQLIPEDSSDNQAVWDVICALHSYIARSRAQLVAVSLADAVMENRAQNQPGTDREYPNWCVPLGDEQGNTVLFEDLKDHEGFRQLCEQMESEVHSSDHSDM